MSFSIPPDDLARYRATAQRHEQDRCEQQRQQRQQQGRHIAKKAAQALATRVRLFGSLLEAKRITRDSDSDLAVDELAYQDYLKALTQVPALSDWQVNLVQIERAAPASEKKLSSKGLIYESAVVDHHPFF